MADRFGNKLRCVVSVHDVVELKGEPEYCPRQRRGILDDRGRQVAGSREVVDNFSIRYLTYVQSAVDLAVFRRDEPNHLEALPNESLEIRAALTRIRKEVRVVRGEGLRKDRICACEVGVSVFRQPDE